MRGQCIRSARKTGCEFSIAQMLLAWVKGKGNRVIRRRCDQKNAEHVVVQRRPGMRLITMVGSLHAPETPTARSSIFSCYFNGLQRFPKLATSSLFRVPP